MISSNVFLQGVPAALTVNGGAIKLVPNAQLAANTTYCYYVQGGVQGTNGLAAQTLGWCFTTGAGVQGTAPTVTGVSPVDGMANVPVNANVRVLFSGPIDPLTANGTIQVSGGGQTIATTMSFGNGNQAVLISPQVPLAASTAYTLTVAGVADVVGNVVSTHTTHFTTGTGTAAVTPVVVNANPLPGAQNVPVNVAISLQANAPIDPTSVNASTFQLYDNTLNQNVSGTYSESADGMTVYFVPSGPLATGRTYQLNFNQYGMTDLVGDVLTYSGAGTINNFSFTTGVGPSTAGPQVMGVSPTNGVTGMPINAQVTIQFNEPVNGETLGQVLLSAAGAPVSMAMSLGNGNQTLLLVPMALSPNTAYTLTIAGVTDLSGNAMSAAVTSTFVTGTGIDFSVPRVLSVSPANQATGVVTTTPIKITFSKLMNSLTITNSTFTVSTSSKSLVTGAISISQDGTSATFAPDAPLSPSTIYNVQASSGTLDLGGQALTAFQSTFTTGSQ